MTYQAPIEEILDCLENGVDIGSLAGRAGFENYDDELLKPVLEEAGKLASEVLAPINSLGDQVGAVLKGNRVVLPDSFASAFETYRDGGWIGLSFPESWGGQSMPRTLALAVTEMVHSANLSFGLCPILSQGAIEALLAHGSEDLKQTYLEKLISGQWTGTMNLTEPQAGSDVGALTTKAVPNEDGTYAISGQKIYITWGEHDCAENIVHLVLARLEGAPKGSKGISLFVVPKFLPDAEGNPGDRNGVKCIGLEKKIGIHASPTCVMEYQNATGWLVGEENRGLACMFTMMNAARLNVGLQGVGASEAAYQAALSYAKERKQGASADWKGEGAAPILYHADVRRNLLEIKAKAMASRHICYACAMAGDLSVSETDPEKKAAYKLREDILTPIAKAWSTDAAVEATSVGVQIHGGMGFMSETLGAQLFKDVRITPIYEGTNGIQAADLVGRKLSLANGAGIRELLDEIHSSVEDGRQSNQPVVVKAADRLRDATEALEAATEWMMEKLKTNKSEALSAATPYLALFGDVLGGHYLLSAELKRGRKGAHGKKLTPVLGFYAENVLPLARGKSAALIGEVDFTAEEVLALFEAS
ncbi:acyl-CoA dehydrogenase [Ponticaulis profundi]|uniref:Acyl-CoA dehydrogenase n=1 Tax=Ponticaulis profundi TaxID=2665222 RepID=A0ABW1SEZ8_9PROT